MKKLLELQQGIIYGPVKSRRLGSSLGINILPTASKVCSFDCVYCQYGWTGDETHCLNADPGRYKLPTVESVTGAVASSLNKLRQENSLPRSLTFCGNGEPTLHPDFADMVRAVINVRNEMAPNVNTSILSNSSRVCDPQCRLALAALDMSYMKLDCGNAEFFARYNKPCSGVDFSCIVDGLTMLAREVPVVIQSLFTSGPSGNLDAKNVEPWLQLIRRIGPTLVHLYTLDRGYPDNLLQPATRDELLDLKLRIDSLGFESKIFL